MTALRNFFAPFIDVKGRFPSYFVDGTLPALIGFNLSLPTGSGMTGLLSSGSNRMKILNVGFNNLSGTIPANLWHNNDQIINTGFDNNQLTSIGTSDLTNLTQIRNLRWQNNEIGPEKWPNLAWGTSKLSHFTRADLSGNRYVFSNMLWKPSNGGGKTIFELYRENATVEFSYGNQKPFGQSRTVRYSVGSNVTIDDFDAVVTHPDNVYQWQKDGSDIPGATSRSLTISGAGASDAGTYRLVVTNPGVPGLTLTSNPIKLVSQ
jgi:hypothetical protein